MTKTVRHDVEDVQARLAELGLEEGALAEVVRRGFIAFVSCTANHPPLYPGFSAWAQMVCALREYLLPLGWMRSDESNYSLVVNAADTIAIAVATGDDATGQPLSEPTTKSPRGTCTIDAVSVNQAQLSLPFEFPPIAPTEDKRLTWILLVHRASNELRCELSLPLSMASNGRVETWRERIILGSIPIDPAMFELPEPLSPLPDVTVDVKRRV